VKVENQTSIVAPAALAVDAAIGPKELETGAHAARLGTNDQAIGGVHGQERDGECSIAAEYRIANFVNHLARPIARDNLICLMQPFRAFSGF
jgi:hypothetical protein